jgi:ABC-type thiamine transport system ATPase subunit
MSSTWLKGILLLAATLGAGIGLGASYDRMHSVQHVERMDHDQVMRRLDRELSLDSTQHAALAAILERRQPMIDSIWASVRPRVRAVLDTTLTDMMMQLRPEQQVKYRAMVERVHPGVMRSTQ